MGPLWLLFRLQVRAKFRRLFRRLNRPRHLILFMVGIFFFGINFLPMFFTTRVMHTDPGVLREYAPLGMLALFLLSASFSFKNPGFYFQPAEIETLFPAPVSRRQLIVYRLVTENAPLAIFSFLMGAMFRRFGGTYVGATLGAFCFFLFNNLGLRIVALLMASVGERFAGRIRKALLFGVPALLAILYLAFNLHSWDGARWHAFLRSDGVHMALMPFVASLEMVLSPTLRGVAAWAALQGGFIAITIWIIVRLDIDFREASIATSQRVQAQLDRMKRSGSMGGLAPAVTKAGWTLPMFPSWGGVGPVAWRQALLFVRAFKTLLKFGLIMAAPLIIGVLVAGRRDSTAAVEILAPLAGMMTIFGIMLLRFDFRGDYDHMEMLRQLPISPMRIAVGQILVPVALLTLLAWTLGAAAIAIKPSLWREVVPTLALVPLVIALAIGVENLAFLVYPIRPAAQVGFDFQNMGRNILLRVVEFLSLGVALGVAAGFGWLAWWVTGGFIPAAVSMAGAVLIAMLGGVLFLVAAAFRSFDVSRDTV